MAVEIPVIVDIDKAFQDAAKRVPEAIEPLQKQISKKQLDVIVNVGTKKKPELKKFKDILNDSQYSATRLGRALLEVDKQISSISKAGGFNPTKGLKQSEKDLLALRAALQMKLEGGNFIDEATAKLKGLSASSREAGATASSSINRINTGLKAQGGLLSMLGRYISVYTAAFAGLRLVRNVREVTAEFEMQRVALAGIIQDTTKANQLFGQIKAAAVQSPFEIKDLIRFTKELSAYRIETDKLFDVTMRLADVSAGLGVDMSRLVLAYGQVRAASVLRGQELRQFTEAGIPLVDLLAKKFQQLRGEMVSTGEVFELISDRAVPFAMIEDIFNDMTNAGGIFYEMQLKQSETLKGQWMKLKDVISIAYDEMGRSSVVNSALRFEIQLLQKVIKEWQRLSGIFTVAVYSFVAYRAAMKGIIPLYNVQQKSIARQIQLEKRQQIEQIRLASKTNALTKADQARIAKIKTLNAEDIKRIYSLNKMSQAQATMFFWRNKDNKEIVKAIQQTGILTKSQMTAINNMSGFQVRIKTWGSSIRTFFTKVGTAIASFWPIAVLSAVLSTISSLVQSLLAQAEAVKQVEKAYNEQYQSLLQVETAYKKIKNAIAEISDEEERAAKEAASFGKKLEQAQNVVELLKKYGMGGDIDLSLLNTDNIDTFVESWLEQLNKVNELTLDWGRNVAKVAHSWEANLLGIHFAGDNLNTDIKQLSNAYVKMTSDRKYKQSVNEMRNYLESLKINYKEYYDLLTSIVGEDVSLAVAQKRRNETEYQYQKRLIKNYEKIRLFAQDSQNLPLGAVNVFSAMDNTALKFEQRLNEVEREFDKTWGSMEDQDEITIKMAIDKVFTENQWEDWLKEAWIERVNERYQMNIQVVPTVGKTDVARGMKGILATEFENLFTEQELSNMSSITEIAKAIEEKMKSATEAIADAELAANNLAESDAWSEKNKEKIKKAQLTIDEELAKDEKDRNKEAINGALDVIDAITKQNGIYEEQIVKRKEAAKAEYELAKAAKDRLLSEGLSDLGKDIKQAFPSLLKDAFRESTDENYISRFLLSDEDLQKIKDGENAYDVWAQHVKDIADAREKMVDAGVTEETVLAEQIRLDEERLSVEQQLEELSRQIGEDTYEEEKARYDALRLAVQQAVTAEERKKAEDKLAEFIDDTNIAERAVLKTEQERLLTLLAANNAAAGAQASMQAYFEALEAAEKGWEAFGKRYNFTLKDKPKGGSVGQDPWIILYKNRMKFMQDFQKGVENLDKYLSHPSSLGREQEIMKGRGLSVGIKTEDLFGTPQELREWYDKAIKEVVSKIRSMGGREFAGLGITEILAKDLTGRKIQKYQELLSELWKGLTDFDTTQMTKQFEDALKKVEDEIKRSETARNFYQNILDLTGNQDLAATMAVSVYGGIGEDFKGNLQKQLNQALASLDGSQLNEDMEKAFAEQNFSKILEYLDLFPTEWQKKLKEMATDNEKYNADWVSDIFKSYQKTKTFEERITDVRNKEAQKRSEISASALLSKEEKQSLLGASRNKEAREVAEIEAEALKNTYEWTQAFKDMERVSTDTLKSLISLLDEYVEKYGSVEGVEALKAIVEAREQAQEQLVVRNAYSQAVDGLKRYVDAKQKANALEKKGKKATIEYKKAQDEARDALKDTEKAISTIGDSFNTLSSIVSSLTDIMDFGEFSNGEAVLNGIATGLGLIGTALVFINAMMTALEANPVVLAISAVIAAIASIASVVKNLRVAKYNREIKRQQELIDALVKSYDRLEKAMEKSFGSDYIYNYNQQLENLIAQQAAYEKQAESERAKAKNEKDYEKNYKEKTEEYLNSAEEAAEKIADMQSQLSEFFSGTNLTSAAKDFASSWIDAYKEFGSTTDAMKEKFQDFVQSMIEQSLGAKIMQTILQPLFDEIDQLAQTGGELSAEEIAQIGKMAPEYIDKINNAMTTMMNQLAAAGYNVRQGISGLTGISRDIAGASEDSITGLAAGINTQNYYMSLISQNVASILSTMIGGDVEGVAGAANPTDPYKDQMLQFAGLLPTMHDDMYAIRSMLEKVIRPNGTTATHYVSAKM